MPARGKRPVIELILNKVWIKIQDVIPKAPSFEKLSLLAFPILRPRQKKIKNSKINARHPKNPVSSAKIAKMESDIDSGRNPYICLDIPNPSPKSPPEPTA